MKVSEYIGAVFPDDESGEIDLTGAERISGGSICDAYKIRMGHRLVFIKKLKEKFASSPRHISALEKEFEIGASLNHPSLPTYLFARKNYVVMNYIEGETLHRLIAQNDPWLSQGANCIKLLSDLVMVTEYLHRQGVMHCDIKADNIVVCKDTNNIYLIDLDKCYTSWHDLTAGAPEKYGLSTTEVGNPRIDLNGISEIAAKLLKIKGISGERKRIRKFLNLCHKDDVTLSEIKSVLDKPRSLNRSLVIGLTVAVIILVVVLILVVMMFQSLQHKPDTPLPTSQSSIQQVDTQAQSGNPSQSISQTQTTIPETSPTVRPKLTSSDKAALKEIFLPYISSSDALVDLIKQNPGRNYRDSLDNIISQFQTFVTRGRDLLSRSHPELEPYDLDLILLSSDEYNEAVNAQNELVKAFSSN